MKNFFEGLNKKDTKEKISRRDFLKLFGMAAVEAVVFLESGCYERVNEKDISKDMSSNKTKKPEAKPTPTEVVPEKIEVSEEKKGFVAEGYYEESFVVAFHTKDQGVLNVFFSFGEKMKKNEHPETKPKIMVGRKFYKALQEATPTKVLLNIGSKKIEAVSINGERMWP